MIENHTYTHVYMKIKQNIKAIPKSISRGATVYSRPEYAKAYKFYKREVINSSASRWVTNGQQDNPEVY